MPTYNFNKYNRLTDLQEYHHVNYRYILKSKSLECMWKIKSFTMIQNDGAVVLCEYNIGAVCAEIFCTQYYRDKDNNTVYNNKQTQTNRRKLY